MSLGSFTPMLQIAMWNRTPCHWPTSCSPFIPNQLYHWSLCGSPFFVLDECWPWISRLPLVRLCQAWLPEGFHEKLPTIFLVKIFLKWSHQNCVWTVTGSLFSVVAICSAYSYCSVVERMKREKLESGLLIHGGKTLHFTAFLPGNSFHDISMKGCSCVMTFVSCSLSVLCLQLSTFHFMHLKKTKKNSWNILLLINIMNCPLFLYLKPPMGIVLQTPGRCCHEVYKSYTALKCCGSLCWFLFFLLYCVWFWTKKKCWVGYLNLLALDSQLAL